MEHSHYKARLTLAEKSMCTLGYGLAMSKAGQKQDKCHWVGPAAATPISEDQKDHNVMIAFKVKC